jgi:hypothetical protein
MKKFRYLIFATLIVTACKTSSSLDSSEAEYVMAYKKSVFYECVNNATSGNLYKFSENNNDLGTATEVAIIYHSDLEHAKKIGMELSSKIRTINYSDYNGKKPIFSDCIEFAFGNYVDSIAKKKYKNLKTNKLEYKTE